MPERWHVLAIALALGVVLWVAFRIPELRTKKIPVIAHPNSHNYHAGTDCPLVDADGGYVEVSESEILKRRLSPCLFCVIKSGRTQETKM